MATPSHVTAALASLNAELPAYQEAQSFYEGTVREYFASRRLRELLKDSGHAFRINFARTPVDVLVERTMVQGITCDNSAAKTILDQVWRDNELGLEAKDVHRRVFEYGDSYIIGWPDEEMPGGVSLYAHDPHTVRVFYDPAQPRRKSHAVHTWHEVGSEDNGLGSGLWHRVELYYRDRIEQWVSSDKVADVDDTGIITGAPASYSSGITGTHGVVVDSDVEYVPYVSDEYPDGVAENPFDMIPVFHFRTGRPYGRPEHADAYGPQNSINKLLITMMAAVDYAGFPQRYVATDDALDPSPQEDAFAASEAYSTTTDQPGLSDDSSMEAGPGSTWLLSGSKIQVGQFQVSDTQNFLNPIHSLIQQMASVTDTPLHYFDRAGQLPSGESLRASESPLTKKTDDRHAQLGVTWSELFTFVLLVHGVSGVDAQIAWEPSEIQTDLASWQSAKLQLEAGVPAEQVYLERGYSADVVAGWVAPPAPAAPPAAPPAQITS